MMFTEQISNQRLQSAMGSCGFLNPTMTPHTSMLDQPEMEDVLLQKLGVRGWGRTHYFRNVFQSGWGEHGNGKSLSPRAFEAFLRFLQAVQFPAMDKEPSVFLTDQGTIELCWEDTRGASVQVEFRRNDAEYFLEHSGEEGTMDYRSLLALAQKLSA